MINLKILTKNILYPPLASQSSNVARGFTLTELLVSIIIGGIIVSSVTAIMTDIVRSSKEEEVRTATQQDMQRALEFIQDDLENATYVYTGDEIRNNRGTTGGTAIAPLRNYLDMNNDYEIVLAFWKPELIPYTPQGGKVPNDCTDSAISNDISIEECETLQTERRTYTLVVYVQDMNPSNIWEGDSIIRRYQLRKFENDEDSTFTDNGQKFLALDIAEYGGNEIYTDPVKEASGFSKWPHSINENLQDNPPVVNGNTSPVLVDFVDDPTNNPASLPTCSNEDTNNNGSLDSGEDDNNNGVLDVYTRTPESDVSTSFFACVRQAGFEGDFSQGNQDVIVYLRGNPDGRSGLELPEEDYSLLPTLQTQVMLRGVVDKFMNQ